MRNTKFTKTVVIALVAAMLLSVSAFASTMGSYLTGYNTPQGVGMTLAKGIFWTGSDYRNENYIEYTPNSTVKPMVVYGSKVTNYGSYSAMSALLEKQGYHVVAGINGDYYNMSNYDPLGVLIYEGKLMSSDSGMSAVGFKADGTAVMGRPYMKSLIDIGGTGFTLSRINKVRTAGEFNLLTPDYAPTTKATSAGYSIICTPSVEYLTMNCSLTLTVDEVIEDKGAVSIPAGKMILSLAATASEDKIAAVKALNVGDTMNVTISSSPLWSNVQFGVGSYRKLVTAGKVESGLDTSLEPRTAIGMKSDGTLIMYTVDGRQSGYSVGANMTQVAQRLIELGCVEASIMDGGGSTSMNAIYLGDESISQINKSSGGTQRSVSNYIVLATQKAPTGAAAQLAIHPLMTNILKGAQRSFTAKAADENGYAAPLPADIKWSVTGGVGTIDQNGVFTATNPGTGTVVATANGLKAASVDVTVTETPESIYVKNQATGSGVTKLTARAGASYDFTASASINHISLLSSDASFTWGVTGGIGSIDQTGKLTIADVTADGAVTVTAGTKTVSIPISVYQTGSFDDVRTTMWFYDAAEYVNEKGLITGIAPRKFAPNQNVSRAMIATILWRMAGSPEPQTAADFTDVTADSWYAKAVSWAQEKGIVTGYENGTFRPNVDVNREQMAAMLYRYETVKNGAPAQTGSLSGFTDSGKISDWAVDAMGWCVGNNIISGMTATTVAPTGTATRAQCAAIIQRYLTK